MDNQDIHKYEPLWGTWNVEEEVGRGSFGTVYKVTREDMGYTYASAVKMITVPSEEQYREAESSIGDDEATLSVYFEDIVKNIVREINLLNTLSDNTNILGYKDHKIIKREDRIGWDILIRMEYVISLRKYLKQNAMSRADVIRLGIDMCTALELCSKKGIIHRDIKDDNIFVNDDGAYKLGDFGIARQLSETSKTATRKTGTLLYMAPEVYKGEKYDAQVDIYSLGIVMYRLLNNGRMPFIPQDKRVVLKADSDEAFERRMQGEQLPAPALADGKLAQIICKACEYKVANRYTMPEEMKRDLVQVFQELSQEDKAFKVLMPFAKSAPQQPSETPVQTPKGTVSKYDGLQSFETTPDKIQEAPQPINKTMSKFSGLENVTEEKQSGYTSNFSGKENTANNLQSQEEQMKTEQLHPIVPETGRQGSTVPKQTVEPSSAVGFDKKNDFESEQKKKRLKRNALLVFVSILIIGVSVWLFSNILKGHANESDVQTNAVAVTTAATTATTTAAATTTATTTAAETTTANTCGNSSGNISNSGIAAQQGDWIFYSHDSDYNDLGYIYKIRTDGTERTQLNNEQSSNINVVGDWIYYSNNVDGGYIYKIRTDGTERTKLNSDTSYYINVVGDWIYYSNGSSGGGFCKIRTDGSERTQLNSDQSSFLNVVGDWIYYCNDVDGGHLYKIRTDGTEKTKLNSDESSFLNVVGDWIYYCNGDYNGGHIYKIRTDGTEKTKLNSDNSSYINVVGDWIYYRRTGGYIYKIRTDGTEKTQLNSDASYSINVVGDWIYYNNGASIGEHIYKMRTDGTSLLTAE